MAKKLGREVGKLFLDLLLSQPDAELVHYIEQLATRLSPQGRADLRHRLNQRSDLIGGKIITDKELNGERLNMIHMAKRGADRYIEQVASKKKTDTPTPSADDNTDEEASSASSRVLSLIMEAEKEGRKWTQVAIAKKAGCNRSIFVRDEQVKAACAALRAHNASKLKNGWKDKDGAIEAVGED